MSNVTKSYIPDGCNAEMEWEEPIPFDDKPVPEFPLECLPEAIRNYAVAVAESTQTSPTMAGAIALAVMATCNQKKFFVRVKPDWKEPLNIYSMAVARPSERKSAVFAHLTDPIREFEAEFNDNHRAEVEADSLRIKALLEKEKYITNQFAKGKASEDELQALQNELACFHPRRLMRLMADDVTPERLTGLIAENNGCISILSAEADVFGTLTERYNADPSMAIWLKGYSGEPVMVDRISRTPERVEAPALTVGLTTQPGMLAAIMKNNRLDGRGLTARILYYLPDSLVGTRNFDSCSIPEDVKQAYFDCIDNMLNSGSYLHPAAIELTDEAYALLREYSNEIEKKIPNQYAGIEAWAGKCIGNTVRIAGNLERAAIRLPYSNPLEEDPYEDWGEGEDMRTAPFRISGESMANAIKIMRCTVEHVLKAYAITGYDPVARNAKIVCGKIKEKGLTEFTQRQMMRLCTGTLSRAEVMENSLRLLTENGYIALKDGDGNASRGRPFKKYLVNPLFLQKSA